MERLPHPRSLLADDAWRLAIRCGLVTLPFTIASCVQTGDEVSFTPVVFGGLLAGYLYDGATSDRSHVATRVGLIGALPVLWMGFDMAVLIGSEIGSPLWFQAIAVAIVLEFIVLGFGMGVVTAMIGAWAGDWLSEKFGRNRPSTAAH